MGRWSVGAKWSVVERYLYRQEICVKHSLTVAEAVESRRHHSEVISIIVKQREKSEQAGELDDEVRNSKGCGLCLHWVSAQVRGPPNFRESGMLSSQVRRPVSIGSHRWLEINYLIRYRTVSRSLAVCGVLSIVKHNQQNHDHSGSCYVLQLFRPMSSI